MPFLIYRDSATATPVDITMEEARHRAQMFRVVEISEDGSVVGDVVPDQGPQGEPEAVQTQPPIPSEVAPVVAAKKAPRAKK